MTSSTWDDLDHQLSVVEGWEIAYDGEDPKRKIILRRSEQSEAFFDDLEAWLHVKARYLSGGSYLHTRAMSYLMANSRLEYAAIMACRPTTSRNSPDALLDVLLPFAKCAERVTEADRRNFGHDPMDVRAVLFHGLRYEDLLAAQDVYNALKPKETTNEQ